MNSNSADSKAGQGCEFQENLNMLRQVPFFATLPLEALKVLAFLCNRHGFADGELVMRSGEDDGQAVYLISGALELVLDQGQEQRFLRTYASGDVVGVLSLWGRTPRVFSLRAAGQTTCLVMTRDRFLKAMEQFPALVPNIVKEMAKRINAWERKFVAEHHPHMAVLGNRAGVSML